MATYVIAGRADDLFLAECQVLAEYLARNCPDVSYRLEIKHPSEWSKFIQGICASYGFYSVNPTITKEAAVIWTAEGKLIGSRHDFARLVNDRYGVISDLSFEQSQKIAKENLKKAAEALQKRQEGPSLLEKAGDALKQFMISGLIDVADGSYDRVIDEGIEFLVRSSRKLGVRYESRTSDKVTEGEATLLQKLTVQVLNSSHYCIMHPFPAAPLHFLLARDYEVSSRDLDNPYLQTPGFLDRQDWRTFWPVLVKSGGLGAYQWVPSSQSHLRSSAIQGFMQVIPLPLDQSLGRLPIQQALESAPEKLYQSFRIADFTFTHVCCRLDPQLDYMTVADVFQKLANLLHIQNNTTPFNLLITSSWLMLVPLKCPTDAPILEPYVFAGIVNLPAFEPQWPQTAGHQVAVPERDRLMSVLSAIVRPQ
eukprot:GILJ01003063.1.p1 GENE.GILJ01003063.1~~GILJ01003063.1.p1  ORF type:complete len:437 (-),score=39.79 GILJ01003063.1:133-1401(-)